MNGERAADYAAFQQRWTELAPSITLYQPLYIFAADGRLGGLGFEENLGPVQPTLFGPEDRYRSVTRWFLNSSREIRGNLP
jgi:peptide/nickel transport system substrate-binding protein